MLRSDALALMAKERREAAEVPKVGEVKAREVPEHVREARFAKLQAKWTGPERAAAIANRAKESLRKSKLPPRMEMFHEKDEQKRLQRLKDPEPEGTFQPFKAREIPDAVKESMWEEMQLRDAARAAKTASEAERLLRLSSLPPRMETSLRESMAAKAADLERIRREADADLTFQPKPSREVPDFSRPFKPTPKPLPPPTTPFRMAKGTPEQVKEKKELELKRILRDMARDETVMPEARWPYKSTRSKVNPTAPPDFQKAWATMPKTGTTHSHEIRVNRREMERLEEQIAKERALKVDRDRREKQRLQTKKVSQALGFPSAEAKKAMEKAEQTERRRKFKKELKDMQDTFDRELSRIMDRVESRPFLFQQSSVDMEERLGYAKFDEIMRKRNINNIYAS